MDDITEDDINMIIGTCTTMCVNVDHRAIRSISDDFRCGGHLTHLCRHVNDQVSNE
jgi:hypothetical protein